MLPAEDHVKWKSILSDDFKYDFKLVAAGLLVSRLRRQLKSDNSAAKKSASVAELISFFKKYEHIMEDDIKAIFG